MQTAKYYVSYNFWLVKVKSHGISVIRQIGTVLMNPTDHYQIEFS